MYHLEYYAFGLTYVSILILWNVGCIYFRKVFGIKTQEQIKCEKYEQKIAQIKQVVREVELFIEDQNKMYN